MKFTVNYEVPDNSRYSAVLSYCQSAGMSFNYQYGLPKSGEIGTIQSKFRNLKEDKELILKFSDVHFIE